MVLLTFHDFEGHSKKRIDHHNRITDLKNVFGQSFPKAGECKAQENIIKFHNIFKDKVIEENWSHKHVVRNLFNLFHTKTNSTSLE